MPRFPSPASGVLSEVKIAEGNTVQINTVVGVISEANGQPAARLPRPKRRLTRARGASSASTSSPAPAKCSIGATGLPWAPRTGLTDVIMPQMGESIFEGTITKWLKKPGDTVQQDEPLFEISTDKVDAEIPSPAAGVLAEIKVEAGNHGADQHRGGTRSTRAGRGAAARRQLQAPQPRLPTRRQQPQPRSETGEAESGERVRSSPLVRKIAKENNVDLRQGCRHRLRRAGLPRKTFSATWPRVVHSSAGGGQNRRQRPPTRHPLPLSCPGGAKPAAAAPAAGGHSRRRAGAADPHALDHCPADGRLQAHQRPCAHRLQDRHEPHCAHREKEKSKYEQRNGVKLTYMPFISRAVIATLRKMPIVNASMEGDAIRYHKNINLGIAVALDWGLIVP